MLEKKVEERTAELRETQTLALQNAHAAGMAEIATGTLHNVGNIINSVNISLDQIQQVMMRSRIPNLIKAVRLLEENHGRLPEFFQTDPRGGKLPEYLLKAGLDIENDRQLVISESEQLVKGIAMVKDVIVAQQSFAKGVFLTEEVSLEQVVEDVLSMQLPTLARQHIQVVKRLGRTPQVKAQKAKLAHIVLNLFKNAREAMLSIPSDRRVLTVETGGDTSKGFFIRVTDTGEEFRKRSGAKFSVTVLQRRKAVMVSACTTARTRWWRWAGS